MRRPVHDPERHRNGASEREQGAGGTPLPRDQQQAEQAVRMLLQWAGEDPAREGLRDTPTRVVRAYRDWFSGYLSDPADYLRRTFEEVEEATTR